MRNLTKSVWVLSALFWLTSCQTQAPVPQEPVLKTKPPPATATAPIPPPEDDLTPSARVSRAMRALQLGDQDSARRQLVWALQSDSSHRNALDLLEQLDADPKQYLGEESFVYKVQPGDSLGKISETYLNDSRKFVILARYNEIENPSLLRVGQSIRIPGRPRVLDERGVAEAAQASSERESASSSAEQHPATRAQATVATITVFEQPTEGSQTPSKEDVVPSAISLYEKAEYREVIMVLEGADSAHRSNESRKLLLDSYIAYANELIGKNDLSAARFTLEKAEALAPDNRAISNALTTVRGKLEGQRLYAEGKSLVEEGRLEEAHQSFLQVLIHDPEHSSAKLDVQQTRRELVDSYHREAMQLFRRQSLDEAISYWNKVLELDPTHGSALAYRARALELKKRLKQLEQ